jgi:phospholipid/cholesterol/gamma-HCH transport system substrate-binding protein
VRLLRAVLLAVVGTLALSGCDFSVYSLPLPGGADLGKNPYTITVEFRDVLDLVPKSTVKVADVSVGRVDQIVTSAGHAVVTLELRRSVDLPDNAEATIRQTSLLGEKFVSLAPPTTGARGRLGNGDVIELDHSGRNPEVEEVLGALSLLLNGGGVAQLKMIATELNTALGGREADVRSLLTQFKVLSTQLDDNKGQIIRALESLNRLSVALDKQKPAITAALDQLPRAVASINRQRDDLVTMLRALSRLSSVGTRVISQSKVATVDTLKALAPTLTKLADAGDALPKAFQIFLTFPFVDAAVGVQPAQARSLHLGDYTNLSVQLDLDLSDLGVGQLCDALPQLGQIPGLCDNPALQACVTAVLGAGDAVTGALTQAQLDHLLASGGTLEDCAGGLLDSVCSDVTKLPAGTPLPGALGDALTQLCGTLQLPGVGGVIPKLPSIPGVPTLSQLQKCLASGKPLGPACDLVKPQVLASTCKARTGDKPAGYGSPTCVAYRALGLGIVDGVLGKLPVGGSGGSGGGSGSGGGGLPPLPVLPGGGLTGANRAGVALGGTSGQGSRSPQEGGGSHRTGHTSDLTAMLVWGMVQR